MGSLVLAFHFSLARPAVGMWESCSDFQGQWDGWKTCFWFSRLSTDPGVDGVSWQEYETGLEGRLVDLHSRVHRGAYRALPSRRVYVGISRKKVRASAKSPNPAEYPSWYPSIRRPPLSQRSAISGSAGECGGRQRDYGKYKDFYAPNVIESQVLRQTETEDTFSLRMLNKAVVAKFALDTDFQNTFKRIDENKWYSLSHTTRVREVENYGLPEEQEAPANTGRGLIWRLYSISRFEQRDGEVYVELEAVALAAMSPERSAGWSIRSCAALREARCRSRFIRRKKPCSKQSSRRVTARNTTPWYNRRFQATYRRFRFETD